PVPECVTGDECLFCHRAEIGSSWPVNHHNRELRKAEPDAQPLADLKSVPALREAAGQVTLLLGGKHFLRFLKPAQEYGKLDLLSVAWQPGRKLVAPEKPQWDGKTFANRCAGCHATAVDPKTRTLA